MRIMLFSFALIFSLGLSAQSNAIDTSMLPNCWAHSFEENEPGWELNIYRPCGYKDFPVARFRFVVELRKDGNCDWLYLAPNDAHRMKAGTWQFSKSTNELVIFDETGKEVHRYEITSIEENMLVLKRL